MLPHVGEPPELLPDRYRYVTNIVKKTLHSLQPQSLFWLNPHHSSVVRCKMIHSAKDPRKDLRKDFKNGDAIL
jgi:hypothetical protein